MKDANVLKKEKQTFFFLVSYYCGVEDGHYRGVGHGRTSRQARRRARRDLRRQMRDFQRQTYYFNPNYHTTKGLLE